MKLNVCLTVSRPIQTNDYDLRTKERSFKECIVTVGYKRKHSNGFFFVFLKTIKTLLMHFYHSTDGFAIIRAHRCYLELLPVLVFLYHSTDLDELYRPTAYTMV